MRVVAHWRVLKDVSRGGPFAGWLLTSEDKTGGVGASKLGEKGSDVLSASDLWIDVGADRFRELACLHRLRAVVLVPDLEQLRDPLTARIVHFEMLHSLHRVPAAQS